MPWTSIYIKEKWYLQKVPNGMLPALELGGQGGGEWGRVALPCGRVPY